MLLLVLVFLYPFFLQFLIVNQTPSSIEGFDQNNLHTSKLISSDTIQWLNDTGFDSNQNWTSGWEIDETDVNATISGGTANFTLNGEVRTFSNVSGVPKNDSYIDGWTQANNSHYPLLPDFYEIDSKGIHVSHDWEDPYDPKQVSSVHWDRNISLPVDMSDYKITNTSLSAAVNASVTTTGTWGIDSLGEMSGQRATNDFVRFYVLISDTDKSEVHEIASYQTTTLGQDSGPEIADLYTTFLTNIDQESIIYHLTSILEVDPTHRNFTITLGLFILCEDNQGMDYDRWNSLRILGCNFSFTYEKNIDKLTSKSWNQGGDKISDLSTEYNVIITDATFNFYYKLDQAWPTSLSPNSEIRVLINNHPHVETIKLSEVNTTYGKIQLGGWEITSLITDYVNFSIQVYLSDEFLLNRSISILLDNVSLYISYDLVEVDPVPTPPIDWSPLVAGLILGIIALIIGFTSYQLYFKYPPMVRQIKALKRKVKKGKRTRPLMVRNRQAIIKTRMRNQMQILRIEPQLEKSGMGAGKKQIVGIFIILFIFAFPFVFQFLNINSSPGLINQGYLRTSAEELGEREWLDYNTFNTKGLWYNSTEGDTSDVNANINNGVANFITEGETHTFSEVSGTPQASDWIAVNNPAFPAFPYYREENQGDIDDTFAINSGGCMAYHYWQEGANQHPSVHWDRNITLPYDMSNYVITSASISAIVNASVDSDPGSGGEGNNGIEALGDNPTNISTGDYARFYVLISDRIKKKTYEIAWNQTAGSFGTDGPGVDNMADTFMTTLTEKKLIDYLTSVLSTDNYNFTVTLGLRIRCEDNIYSDDDGFRYLYIKSCNLTFTYEKKISQLTTVSWNQDCDEINSLRYNDGNTVIVLSANLNFYYKISEEWPTALSPNAEIRVLINNYKHSEPIKLSKATTSFQEAKTNGFDIYHLIPGNNSYNLNFSVQVYLGDDFGLNRSITVSIDNVDLLISYKIIGIIPPPSGGIDWTPLTVGLSVLLVGLIVVFTSYQLYFRFPPIIRRVRTLRRKIKKGKKTKPILVQKRDAVVKNRLRKQLQVLRIQPTLEKADIVSQSKPIGKIKK